MKEIVKGISGYDEPINENFNETDNRLEELESIANSNLLINGNFNKKAIINQRGQNEYQLNGYTIDMWRLYKKYGHYSSKLRLTDESIVMSHNMNNDDHIENNYTRVEQCFENYINASSFTVSIDCKSNISSTTEARIFLVFCDESGHISKGINIGADRQIYSGTINNPLKKDIGRIIIQLSDEENSEIELYSVKLERGNRATPFIDEDKSIKLAKCQRYLQKIDDHQLVRASDVSVNNMYFTLHLTTTMRINPSIIGVEKIEIREFGNASNIMYSEKDFSIYSIGAQLSTLYIAVISAGHGLIDAFLEIENSSNGYILLSAEL